LRFSGLEKLFNALPVNGHTGTKIGPARQDQGKQPKAGIATIQQRKVMDREFSKMGTGQFTFPLVFGCNNGINGYTIEWIKHLGDPGHWAQVASDGMPGTEMGNDIGDLRQPNRCPINGFQIETIPFEWGKMVIEILDDSIIELDKGIIGQLDSGLTPSHFGDKALGDIPSVDGFEERVKFFLIRTCGKMEQKENDDMKGQFAASAKGLRR